MTKKLTIGEIIQINDSIKTIIDDKNLNITPLFKFKLLGIMKNFESYKLNFEIMRNDAIRKYGKETDDGNFKIEPDDTEAIKKLTGELEPVLNTEIDIDVSLNADEAFHSGITADQLLALYNIMKV